MTEISVNKAVITAINILILSGLPIMALWHYKQAKKKEHLSYDWMVQIMIIFLYIMCISAEIPALWSRWKAYYELRTQLPDVMYKLTTWDRWSHLLAYLVLFLLTHTITSKKVPKIVKDTLL